MRATIRHLTIGLTAAIAGCHTPPPRVPVPSESGGNPYSTYERDSAKPLPPSATENPSSPPAPPPPPQPIPPQAPTVPQSYLDAYDRVGRPRLLVLVDRVDQPEKSLVPGDYELLERVVRDALAAGGHVAIVPASTAHERITPQQLRDIQAGLSTTLTDVGATLRADILVEVKPATVNNQTQLTASARNVRDGQQIATAASQIPSASPRRQIDFAGRLLGERMVDALADAWEKLARDAATRPAASTPASTQAAGNS